MLTSAFSFTRLRAQFIKEVLSVLRDPRSRMVVFVPPILQLLVFAFAATLEVRNVDIAVYNQDAGRWSLELMQVLGDGRRSNSGQITVAYLSTVAAEVGAAVVPGTQAPTPVVVRHWFNPNLVYS